MTQAYFITGTDTEIGKTSATCALLALATHARLRAAALKPVAAGTNAHGQNDDVIRLMQSSNVPLDTKIVNPWLFRAPLSPHIAARHAGVEITLPPIVTSYQQACTQADLVLVEGVGGLCAPLSDTLSQPDLIRALNIPVILVIGLRLGCLNHALLTVAALIQEGCRLAGWIGNQIEPQFYAAQDNIDTLRQRIAAPCLGLLPYRPGGNLAELAACLILP